MALSEAVTHCIYPIWICQSASLESSDSLKPGVCMKTLTVSWKWHSSGSQPAQLISERNGKEQELQILQLRCNSLALENRDEDSLYFESNCWVCTKSISGYMINIIFPLWVLIPDGSQLPPLENDCEETVKGLCWGKTRYDEEWMRRPFQHNVFMHSMHTVERRLLPHFFEVVAVLVLNTHTHKSLSLNAYKFKLDNFLTIYFVHVIKYYTSIILQEIRLDICIAM